MTAENTGLQEQTVTQDGALPMETPEVATKEVPTEKPVVKTPSNPTWFDRHQSETIGMIATIAVTGFALVVSISGL